uniref:NADH dehydrogenase subunit 5 n=1 Tax=Brugia timori TaxID=42155 RepID=A0A0R3QB82_9BILA
LISAMNSAPELFSLTFSVRTVPYTLSFLKTSAMYFFIVRETS